MNRSSIVNALNSLRRTLPEASASVTLYGRRYAAIRTVSRATASVFSEGDLGETERYGLTDYTPDRIPQRFDPVDVRRKGITTKRVITSAKRDPLDATLIIGVSSPFSDPVTITGRRRARAGTGGGASDVLAAIGALVSAGGFADAPMDAVAQTTDRTFTVWVRMSDLENIIEPQTGDAIELTVPEGIQNLHVATAIRQSQCWVLTCRTAGGRNIRRDT